jgi:DNA-binding transcriptional LysR family regulator
MTELVTSALRDLRVDLPVDVEFGTTMQLLDALRRHELDLTLAHLPLSEPDLEIVPLARYDTGLVVSDGHELAGRYEIEVHELRGLRMFMLGPDRQPATIQRALNRLRGLGVLVEQLPDADLVHVAQLVQHGRGVTMSSVIGPAAHLFDQPGLRLIPVRDPELELEVGITLRRDGDRAPWLDQLVRTLPALVSGDPRGH